MQAESAIMALNCSGMILGTQPIRYCFVQKVMPERKFVVFWQMQMNVCCDICRVSPSKTPVRPRLPRPGN